MQRKLQWKHGCCSRASAAVLQGSDGLAQPSLLQGPRPLRGGGRGPFQSTLRKAEEATMLVVYILAAWLAASVLFAAVWAYGGRRRRQQAAARVHEWAHQPVRRGVGYQPKPDGRRNRRRRLRRRKLCRSHSRQYRKVLRRVARQTKRADRWRFQ